MQPGNQADVSPPTASDLDWSQVSETVRMLKLAVAQISMAMHEGDDSVDSLTASFTNLAVQVDGISDAASASTPDQVCGDSREIILSNCEAVRGGIQQSIIAFQFYDRLSQRLDHVRYALGSLATLVADKGKVYDPDSWVELQESIRGKYSMREEQEMFDALVNGASVEEALDIVRGRVHEGDIDDIELF